MADNAKADGLNSLSETTERAHSREQLIELVCSYLGHDYSDAEGRARYFSDDAVLEDPVGSPPTRGHADILKHFQLVVSSGYRSRLNYERIIVCGDEAIVPCSIDVSLDGQAIMKVTGIICLEYSSGLISQMRVFFDDDSTVALGQ